MKTSIKNLPKSMIEIEFEIMPDEFEEFLNEAAKECSHIKIEGFRPGKAPRALIEEKLGASHLWEHAAKIAVKKTYIKEILDKKIEAISQPEIQIKKIAPNNPFIFSAKTAIMPKIELGSYKNLKVKHEEVKVDKKEIEEAMLWLQKSRAKYSESNEPIQKGDLIDFNLESKINGVKIENGEIKNQILIIGEDQLLPDVEKNLIGMKKNEEKEFSVKIPDNYHQKNIYGEPIKFMADKIVDFKVKINNIQKRELPEINDEFAKSIGNFKNLETLENSVANGLKFEKEKKEQKRWQLELIRKISETSKMSLPDILIEKEKEKMIDELAHSIEDNMGLKFDDYLLQIKKTVDNLKKDFQKDAEERVRIALILREIAKKENIEPNREEIESRANEYLKHYFSVREAEKNIDPQQLFEYTKGVLRNEKVFDFLEKHN